MMGGQNATWRTLLTWVAGVSLGFSSAGYADDRWTQAGEVLLYALPLTAATATYTLDDPDGRSQLVMGGQPATWRTLLTWVAGVSLGFSSAG